MGNLDYSQLELFSQAQETNVATRPPGLGASFLKFVRGYEKIILLVIAFLITGIASFSLGVEKGKRLVYQTTPVRANAEKASPPAETQVQQMPVQKENALENYTVQLASYLTRDSARQEVEILKKKGFSPLILSKGKYTVLCVGNFSDKEKAKALLAEFEKQNRYKGCFIRRL